MDDRVGALEIADNDGTLKKLSLQNADGTPLEGQINERLAETSLAQLLIKSLYEFTKRNTIQRTVDDNREDVPITVRN